MTRRAQHQPTLMGAIVIDSFPRRVNQHETMVCLRLCVALWLLAAAATPCAGNSSGYIMLNMRMFDGVYPTAASAPFTDRQMPPRGALSLVILGGPPDAAPGTPW